MLPGSSVTFEVVARQIKTVTDLLTRQVEHLSELMRELKDDKSYINSSDIELRVDSTNLYVQVLIFRTVTTVQELSHRLRQRHTCQMSIINGSSSAGSSLLQKDFFGACFVMPHGRFHFSNTFLVDLLKLG